MRRAEAGRDWREPANVNRLSGKVQAEDKTWQEGAPSGGKGFAIPNHWIVLSEPTKKQWSLMCRFFGDRIFGLVDSIRAGTYLLYKGWFCRIGVKTGLRKQNQADTGRINERKPLGRGYKRRGGFS